MVESSHLELSTMVRNDAYNFIQLHHSWKFQFGTFNRVVTNATRNFLPVVPASYSLSSLRFCLKPATHYLRTMMKKEWMDEICEKRE